jgi:hypothetical protein
MLNHFPDAGDCKTQDHTVMWFTVIGIVVAALLPFVI